MVGSTCFTLIIITHGSFTANSFSNILGVFRRLAFMLVENFFDSTKFWRVL